MAIVPSEVTIDGEVWISTRLAAEALGCHMNTIRNRCLDGTIEHRMIERKRFVKKAWLEEKNEEIRIVIRGY